MQSLRAPTLALGVSEGAKRRAVAGTRLARPVSLRHHHRRGALIRDNAFVADADQAQRWIDAWKARLNAPRVVGVGSAGVDYLASIAAFPKPDQKLRTDAFETQGGGNCGNALTAVARLGLRPSILTKLSDDGAGKAILDEFRDDGPLGDRICSLSVGSAPPSAALLDFLHEVASLRDAVCTYL